MNKAISIGIIGAVMTLTSTAAFAESTGSSELTGAYLTAAKTAGEYVNGSNVTFTVRMTRAGVERGGFVVKSEGLELVDSKVEGGSFAASTGIATFSGGSYAKDSTVATFTYKVIAKTGENVRFAISDHTDYPGAVDPIPVTGMVTEAANSGTSSAMSSGNSGTANSGSSSAANGVPATGVAITVVPAVLAGAAILVAARKRK